MLEPTTDPVPDTLAGKWRVEEIDGLSTEGMRRMQFTADETEIWWEPRCAGFVQPYRLKGRRIDIGPEQRPPAPPRPPSADPLPPPPPVCTIGLPPYLADARTALLAAETIRRDNRNHLVIAGGGHYIVLAKR